MDPRRPFLTVSAQQSPIEPESWRALQEVVKALQEKKALHILVLDVRGLSSLTEFLVIAEGNVERHVQTLAQEVLEQANEGGLQVFHEEGLGEGSWVLLELSDVMVHVMIPTWRSFYALERMWPQARIIPIQELLSANQESLNTVQSAISPCAAFGASPTKPASAGSKHGC
jgi:ribosome-associated protein